jgi:hypothetical protein
MRVAVKWFFFLLLASTPAIAGSPNSVVVNRIKWRIVREPDIKVGQRWYSGYTLCDKHVIRIEEDLGRCFEAVALFHELEHASVCHQNFELQQMNGHQAIERIAFGMSKIIADNPKLRRYFGRASKCSWTDEE